jgi:hypothetical protein
LLMGAGLVSGSSVQVCAARIPEGCACLVYLVVFL